MPRKIQRSREFEMVNRIIETTPSVDPFKTIPVEEYRERRRRVHEALQDEAIDVGFVFSDEHYNGDVPYLGGNTNISIEQVAGVIGKTGFHIVAGLEGGYIAEQLARRAKTPVHKVEMLQLADEKYPIEAERLEDVLQAAHGGPVRRIGLLSPRQVVPAGVVEYLESLVGKGNLIDCQEIYWRLKYEKSPMEIELITDASVIADAMLRAMLAVLKPGMLETQVAAWGYYVGRELGSEETGFDIMVGSDEANRTLIGKALNRPVQHGEMVHLGVSPKREGLTTCVRRSVVALPAGESMATDQEYWFDLVEGAYQVGYDEYLHVAAEGLPARLQEQALVDYFASHSEEVSRRIGHKVDLARLKPYTGTHNAGYTECQEFYGAITLESEEPLGYRIVTMLDVALRGIGNLWDDVQIPGFDFLVVENTLGKEGPKVETLTKLPIRVQSFVGNINELD